MGLRDYRFGMATSVAIVGVSGYSGLELLRLLASDERFEVIGAHSDRARGERLRDLLPLADAGRSRLDASLVVEPQSTALERSSRAALVALATPAEVSAELAPKLCAAGCRVVDLSGAFRLEDAATFREYYRFEHPHPELLGTTPYGLPELPSVQGAPIRAAKLIANPGCYATAAILSLAPLLAEGVIELDGIFIHGKSGVSGAGRKLAENYLFMEVDENVSAYRVGDHQHTPEIELAARRACQKPVTITFAPHLLPIKRGLLTTSFARLARDLTTERALEIMSDAYASSTVVGVGAVETATIESVARTPGARVGVKVDRRNRALVTACALDNLLKGAASQALENLVALTRG
jgi:N-acetyl-gamma-glutamyl-phosphate reductase